MSILTPQKLVRKTLLTNLQIISIKQNKIMIFKILKRLSEGYHKAILAQKSTKKHFAKSLQSALKR